MSGIEGATAADALRRFGACLEHGDTEAAAACFTEDAVYEEPPRFAFTGRPALRAFIADFLARHTEVRFTVARTLASADGALMAAEWRWSYRSLDGSAHAFAGMCFVELRDGLIARWRGYSVAVG
ncbi:MAG TPA: nuclear transport factor 2 family protein [Ktedonobacterales bacterium]|nr:nuclear transport factor 2 family protein [Ktedonobacterales bacterium]